MNGYRCWLNPIYVGFAALTVLNIAFNSPPFTIVSNVMDSSYDCLLYWDGGSFKIFDLFSSST